MEYRIARAVKNQARVSYALGAETPPCEVDCGEGVNVELASPAARRAFATLDFNMCAPYPHANELKEAIAAYWKDYAALGDENIVLTEGSVTGLYLVNRLFLEPNDRVLGGASLFFEYGADVRLHGCFFETVPLKAEENYRFSAARFAAALSPRFKLAAFDNPNNPTGQAISPAELERILAAAREANVCVLVDEAYGDYVPRGRSAVSLFDAYDNLIVARSFSKGFGLAGLRAGYLLLPPGLAAAANNLSNPYAVSSLSRHVAAAALSEPEFLNELRARTAAAKRRLLRPWRRLSFAHTDDSVAICMVVHADPNVDLAREFARRGVLAVSCEGFAGRNAARLRVPVGPRLEKVLTAMERNDAGQ